MEGIFGKLKRRLLLYKSLLTTVTSIIFTANVFGQADCPTSTCPPSSFINSVGINESINYWVKDNSPTIVELNSTINGKIYDLLGWHVTVPVYSQTSTGYGAIDLGLDYSLIKSAKFLGSDASLGINGGVLLPTGSAYFANPNANVYVGVDYAMTWGKIEYTQTADIQFVGLQAYTPVFGNVNDYVINADSFVAYQMDEVKVGAGIQQWYTTGSSVAFLGPKVEWSVSNNVSVECGVGFPVWQNISDDQQNTAVASLGFGVKF